MKTLMTLSTFLLFFVFSSQGAILTVSNLPVGGAMYGSLQAAYNAASSGDTLLLEGTNVPYHLNCGQYFEKPLVIIGAGLNTDKDLFKYTYIRNTDCMNEFRMRSGGNGSKFYGIVFTNNTMWWSDGISDYLFENCQFNNYTGPWQNFTLSSMVFRNCHWHGDNNHNFGFPSTTASSFVYSNCTFDGYLTAGNNPYLILFMEHCLFFRTNGPSLNGIRYATVSNCIFMNNDVADGNTLDCIFSNNISTSANLPPAGNVGSGNFASTDPLFVSYAGGFFSYGQDFHLDPASVGIGAGNDGTDIGIYGGTTHYSHTGEPLNTPVMRSMTINNSTVSPGGTLNVQVEASKPIDE